METWIFLYRYIFDHPIEDKYEMEIRISLEDGQTRCSSFRTQIDHTTYVKMGGFEKEIPTKSSYWCKFKIYSTEKQTT